MLEGNYTIKTSTFTELVGATMDVDSSGEQGQFTFIGTPPVKMHFSDPQHFQVEGPNGTWTFSVNLNLPVIGKDEIKADGKVFSPLAGDEGDYTSTATTPTGEVEDTAAKAATEG